MKQVSNDKKVPIRGWLVLIAIPVWMMGIFGVFPIISDILRLFVSIPSTLSPFMVVFGLIQSVVSILLLVLFIRRKRIFIRLAVCFLVVLFAYDIYFAIAVHHPEVSFVADIVYLPLYVISALYLLRSERVRNTFVR